MFTLKHVSPMGNEMLIETDQVSYTPHAEPPAPEPGYGLSAGNLWFKSRISDELVPIPTGSVYVMNEKGSTIAKYDLGGWETVKAA